MRRSGRGWTRRGALAGAGALLPVAAAARAAVPLPVEEVAPGVFVHRGRHEDFTPENRGAIANLGFVVGDEAVAVIDTGGSPLQGAALRAAVRARTDRPIAWVVNTHVHPDHVLGNVAFRATGTTFVGHRRLAVAMAERGPLYLDNMRRLLGPAAAGAALVPPQRPVAIDAPQEIDLGGRVLRLRAWPTAHTDTDLTALDLATGTLFAGDLLFLERIPIVDGSLLGWLEVLDELERIAAVRVVPGHGPAVAPWPRALAPERAYLEVLRDEVRRILAAGVPLADAVEAVPPPPGQAWLLADPGHARNVIASYKELEWE